MTIQELKKLGDQIDSVMLHAKDIDGLYRKLAKFSHEEWTTLRAPVWIGELLVIMIVRPRKAP